MKMKKFFKQFNLTLLLSVTILSVKITCYAETTLKIDYDAENVSIKATVDSDKKNKTAVLSVISNGRYFILTEFQRKSKDDFSIVCKLPADLKSGNYTAKVIIGGETAEDEFTHINGLLAEEAMEVINNATLENFAEKMKSVYEDLSVDITEFNKYSDSLVKLYFKYKPEGDLTSAKFIALYSKCLKLCQLSQMTTDSDISDFLKDNRTELEFDYDKFKALSADEKAYIINFFKEANYTEKTLAAQYSHWFCLADLNVKRLSSISVYQTALLNYIEKGVISLNLEVYETIQDKSEVIRTLMQQDYTTIKDIIKDFNDVVYTVKAREGKKNHGSGSSSSSGGGSSSGGRGYVNWMPSKEDMKKSITFNDVKKEDWFYNAILDLSFQGVINGYDNGSFAPNNNVTRAEFTKMILLALFNNYRTNNTNQFVDISETDWYADYVNSAVELGIVKGTDAGEFLPNKDINRQDAAVMIFRAMNKAGFIFNTNGKTFDDSNEISEYAEEAISQLAGIGVVNGVDGNNFAPKGKMNRAQAAKILYEAMSLVQSFKQEV